MRRKDVAVVVDVDDDLSVIHPDNPAWDMLRPNHRSRYVGKSWMHSWKHLGEACREATLVTATTPALIKRYAPLGNGVVLPNYLAPHYYDVEHEDSDLLGWPASLQSHPNDPEVVGNAVARLVDGGARFHVTSHAAGVGAAFGLASDDVVSRVDRPISLLDWPREVSRIGVGVAPLADTKFNEAKSWLKPLELSALGVPWVASPRAEYRRLHQLGCGLLAERPKDWYAVLRRLLTDAGRRAELADAGRAVAATLRLEDHAWRWAEAWTDALVRQRAGRVSATVVG
jgi:Glycosyl transferases group 1